MLDIYGTLEIRKVLECVASNAHSEIAKEKILSLKMLPNKKEVNLALVNLNEMLSLVLRHGNLPISASLDISKYISTAKKGGILTPLDLDHIANDIEVAGKINDYFKVVEKTLYPSLLSLSSRLFDLSSLENEIRKVVAPNLEIYDSASLKLKKIRQSIHSLEIEVRSSTRPLISKYHEYLSEDTVTIRNDHFVLPVLSQYKNKVPGVIHDISDSAQTTFIEPTQLVELSNKICVLKVEEKEEISRLLKCLSELVVKSAPEVLSNNILIAELDFISAKAIYGNSINGLVANLSDNQVIEISKARHPLIDQTKVVANDFVLNNDQRIIIISGPNAGGKTVALKTLGLMVMMNQMGLALPTSIPANLGYFPKIYADIGDNQSLSDNLSTFAAHVSNLSTITHFVTKDDLVLLDELGTGTSPNEGEAIALATTDYLLEKRCFALISSHFEAMKEYAYRRNNVINAMMVFDEKNLLPTYLLKLGYPGRSYGLEMAKRYHLHEDVVKSARENLKKNNTRNVNDVIDKLNKVLRQNEELNKELKEKQRLIEGKQKDLAFKEKTLANKKENLLSEVNIEKEKLLLNTQNQIDEILKIINKPNVKAHEVIKAKTDLKKLSETIDEDISFNEQINEGDYVKIISLDIVGRVSKANGKKIEIVTPDGMTVKSNIEKVCKTSAPSSRKVVKTNVDELVRVKTDVKLELNLIGEHVEDALIKLSKYLDDARVKHFHEVRIIHGMGSGALRNAIHTYLSKQEFVEEYHYGGPYDGSTGATIVKLK